VAAREIIDRYPPGRSRSALLPMLHLVQSEEGYVTAEGVDFCAEQLGLTAAEVSAVATFYTMYKRRPVGDWLVSVCTNLSCSLLGGQQVFDRLSEHLGIHHDEVTADGTTTLEHAECLAACDYAPVMTVNYEFFDKVDPERAQAIVDALARGERPHPDRGGPLCTFAEASRQLAGWPDPRGEAVGSTDAVEESLAGLRYAEANQGWTPPDIAVPDPDKPLTGPAPGPGDGAQANTANTATASKGA
jgi:NADH-quinone oxidoreductase subunit E